MSKVQSIAAKQRKRAYRALHIGTSGWTYDDWRGRFYPKALPRKDWLAWYSTRFSSTEINGSFYRTPSIEAVQTWRDTTPSHFQFAWKASKFITHWKRLSPKSKNSIELMVSRLAILGRKCGPVLFQLPSRFKVDHDRLAQFLHMLPSTYEYAFEFRHDSWYEQSIFLLLENNNAALCISDHYQAPAPWIATARHAYIRGHGPTGRYKGSYPQSTLQDWATRIGAWRHRQKKSVYVYFDNDQKSAAPKDAARLRALLCVG